MTDSLSPIERLVERLRERLPKAALQLDRPVSAEGMWLLDVAAAGRMTSVEWRPSRGFGVSAGFGEEPREWVASVDAAVERVVDSLGGDPRRGVDVGLAALRHRVGVSQVELARRLGSHQAAVSKLEHRADPMLSSLVAYVEALGATLEVSARLPDGTTVCVFPSRSARTVRRASERS